MSKAELFVDRGYKRNHWYVRINGRFVAGPYPNKGEAIKWIKEQGAQYV